MELGNFKQFNNNGGKEVLLKTDLLMDVPESKIRLYAVIELLKSKFFDKKKDFIKYVNSNKKYTGQLAVIDYLGRMSDRLDVIRVAYGDGSVKYFSIEDSLGYVVYNGEKSQSLGVSVWDYEYGDLRDLVDELKKHGIKMENDVYGMEDELYSSVSDGFVEPLKRK